MHGNKQVSFLEQRNYTADIMDPVKITDSKNTFHKCLVMPTMDNEHYVQGIMLFNAMLLFAVVDSIFVNLCECSLMMMMMMMMMLMLILNSYFLFAVL